MRKIFFLTLLLCGLFLCCNQLNRIGEPISNPVSDSLHIEGSSPDDIHFSYVVYPEASAQQVSYKSLYWKKGQTIKVAFQGGTKANRAFVEHTVKSAIDKYDLNIVWNQPWQESDIRITFQAGKGSYSMLGKASASQSVRNRSSMNFGWLNRQVVLHEFVAHGVCAQVHEHQHPTDTVWFNRSKVISDLSGPPNNWDISRIKHNMFNKPPLNLVDYTPVRDDESISKYKFPCSWVVDGKGCQGGGDFLSAGDEALLLRLYGLKNAEPEPPTPEPCPECPTCPDPDPCPECPDCPTCPPEKVCPECPKCCECPDCPDSIEDMKEILRFAMGSSLTWRYISLDHWRGIATKLGVPYDDIMALPYTDDQKRQLMMRRLVIEIGLM